MYLMLVVLFLICAIIRYVSQVRNSRIYEVVFQYPPCFRELPLLGSFYHFWSYKNNSEDTLKKILEMGSNTMKAGGITRLYSLNTSMFYVVLTDASDIAEVLVSYLNKDGVYNVVKVVTGNGSIFEPEHSISKVRRRAILPLLSSKFLSKYIECTWLESVTLTEVLAPFVGKGPFAAGPYLGTFCFNSVLRWAEIPELIKEEYTMTLLHDFHRCFRLMYERLTSLWMLPNLVYKYTANYAETQKYFRSFQDFANKGVQIRKKRSSRISTQISSDKNEKNETRGFIDGLLRSQLPEQDIVEEVIVLTGASEEAGVAIGFALMLFGQYPAVQDRVYEELVNIYGELDRPLEKEELAKLPYLDLLVKEVLRLYPPVPLMVRKADKEKKLSSGRVIPEGAGIVVSIVSLHRNPKYWGPDAEHFDPERFLPERLATVPDNAYIPFSSGQRSCVGGQLANFMVKLGLCAILWRYKVVGTPATGPVPHIRNKFEIVLRPINNYEIELVNRI